MDVSKAKNDHLAKSSANATRESSSVARPKNLNKGQSALDALAPQSAPTTEKVNWSEDAALVAQGLDAIKATPDVRADKVAQIKAAIKNGTYKVDAKDVADKMIESAIADEVSQSERS
jgi:negative regulator of flagellin synthesis FlgM